MMKTEVTLSLRELREIVMGAWVDGWRYHKNDSNDNRKRHYFQTIINKLFEEE